MFTGLTHRLTSNQPTAINFLDSGSTVALRSNISAWSPNSNQHRLMTSFYQYFGYFFGCRSPSFPAYNGSSSQTSVHRFMDLQGPQMHYFIHNIVDAATNLGVAGEDLVTHVGDGISVGIAIDNIFNKRCSPPTEIVPGQGAQPQSMCADEKTCAVWAFNETKTSAPYNLTDYGVPPELAAQGEANVCGVGGGSGDWGDWNRTHP